MTRRTRISRLSTLADSRSVEGKHDWFSVCLHSSSCSSSSGVLWASDHSVFTRREEVLRGRLRIRNCGITACRWLPAAEWRWAQVFALCVRVLGLPQQTATNWGLKTKHIYSLTVVEARHPKWRCYQAMFLQRLWEAPDGTRPPELARITPVPASAGTWLSLLSSD